MDGPKKKKDGCVHVHKKKWTDLKKKKGTDACMAMKKKWTDQKEKKQRRMHVHEQKWTDTKKKKINNEVTVSHVGKSMTQSRRTKYLKNGTLREDYNASRRLKVRASRVSGAMYQWPTMKKNAQSYI